MILRLGVQQVILVFTRQKRGGNCGLSDGHELRTPGQEGIYGFVVRTPKGLEESSLDPFHSGIAHRKRELVEVSR